MLESEARAMADYYVLSSSRRVKGARHVVNLVVKVPNKWQRGIKRQGKGMHLCGILKHGQSHYSVTLRSHITYSYNPSRIPWLDFPS